MTCTHTHTHTHTHRHTHKEGSRGAHTHTHTPQVAAILTTATHEASLLAKDRAFDANGRVVDEAMRDSYVRLSLATSHSYRVGFVAWCARAGGQQAYVQGRVGGRWDDLSPVYDMYWGKGETRRNQFRGVRDPIHDILPFPIQGFTFRETPDLHSMRMAARRQDQRRKDSRSGGGKREGRMGRPSAGTVRRSA